MNEQNVKLKVINIGVCNGRHDLPCSEFVFDKIEDPTNVAELEERAYTYLTRQIIENCVIENCNIRLNLYITGLTVATLAIENALIALERKYWLKNITVYFMHYDKATNTYYEQMRYPIFS